MDENAAPGARSDCDGLYLPPRVLCRRGASGAVRSEAVEGKPTGADVARVLVQTLMSSQRPGDVAGSRFSTGGGAGRR